MLLSTNSTASPEEIRQAFRDSFKRQTKVILKRSEEPTADSTGVQKVVRDSYKSQTKVELEPSLESRADLTGDLNIARELCYCEAAVIGMLGDRGL